MKKTDIVLLTAGILATGILMASGTAAPMVSEYADIPERTITAHVSGTVSAPAAEVKPVETAVVFQDAAGGLAELPVEVGNCSDDEFESDMSKETSTLQSSESTLEAETEPEPELIEEPEPEAVPDPEPEPEPNEGGEITYLGDWTITFYCPNECCCGQWAGGPTASGVMPQEWHTVACGSLPFGTCLYIEGLGNFVVEDRGVEGEWLDVFLESHELCGQYGMQTRAVYIAE